LIYIEYLGIDISKKDSVIAHYSEKQFVKEFTMQNNQNGFNHLLKYLKQFHDMCLIFESTGIYSRAMAKFCKTNHINFVEINPLEAKFKTSSLRSWKTDKSDAHKLALLAPNLSKKSMKQSDSSIYFELRERARFHLEIENNQNRLKIELIEVLHQTFPGLENLFKNRYSIIALNIAECFSHPDFVLQKAPHTLTLDILNSTNKGMSLEKADKYSTLLLQLANKSYPNVEAESFLVQKVQIITQQLKFSIQQMNKLDNEMIDLARELNCFQNIISIPGIGELTAAMIIGELGDISNFHSHKQLNAFVGIDIKRYQSGLTHYRDTINKRGNKKARRLLFLVICNILRGQHRFENHIVDYYYKLRKQPNEKSHKTAIVACMNRLLKTIHYLVTNNKLYDYQMSPH